MLNDITETYRDEGKRLMKGRPRVLIALLCSFLFACNDTSYSSETDPTEGRIAMKAEEINQSAEIAVLAYQALNEIQADSILSNIEYCGYIVRNAENKLQIVGPASGTRFQCVSPLVYEPNKIVASYHTQGGYEPSARSEIPSTTDFDAVTQDGVDAFIATPGGRFWHLDFETATARLLCGPSECLLQDERSVPVPDREALQTLTRPHAAQIEGRQD